MFADPEWFTCIKDTILRTKMQETRGLFLRDLFLHAIRAEDSAFLPGAAPEGSLPGGAPFFYAAANFHFTNAARTVTITIKAMPKGRSFSSTVRNRSDSAGAAQNALIRRFFA